MGTNRADLKTVDPNTSLTIHFLVGEALWQVQAFEEILCGFILLCLKLPASRAEAEARAILGNLEKKTLGQLMTELRKSNSTNSVSAFEVRLAKFLAERNWLVHESRRHANLFKPETVGPLVARLHAISGESIALQSIFVGLMEAWTIGEGYSESDMQDRIKQHLREWGAMD